MKTALTLAALLAAAAGFAAGPAGAQSIFGPPPPPGGFQTYHPPAAYHQPTPIPSIAPVYTPKAPQAPKMPGAEDSEMFKPYRGASTYDSQGSNLEPDGKPAKRKRGYSTY